MKDNPENAAGQKRVNISLDAELWLQATAYAKDHKIPGKLSGYITNLIKKDLNYVPANRVKLGNPSESPFEERRNTAQDR